MQAVVGTAYRRVLYRDKADLPQEPQVIETRSG
jgi:hypothetical protein